MTNSIKIKSVMAFISMATSIRALSISISISTIDKKAINLLTFSLMTAA